MRTVHTLLLLFVLAAGAAAQQTLASGSNAPQFSLAGYDVQTYDLNQLRGKVVQPLRELPPHNRRGPV